MFNDSEKIVKNFLRSGRNVGGAERRGGAEGSEVEGEREVNVTIVLSKAAHRLLEPVNKKQAMVILNVYFKIKRPLEN